MRLTLHIGLGKTGTSSLQAFLEYEEKFLAEHRLKYTGINLVRLHEDYRLPDQGVVNRPGEIEKSMDAIQTAARKLTDIDELIWSNESLGMGFARHELAPKIHAALQGSDIITDVRVLLVVRRQDDWIESAFRQWALKHKVNPRAHILGPMRFAETMARVMDYEALYDSWSIFGKDAVTLIPYEDVRAGRGIVEYFCNAYGLEYHDRFDTYGDTNKSLGVSQSSFMGVYARGYSRAVMPGEFQGIIERFDLPELSGPRVGFFSNEQRAEVLANYADSNKRLAQKVFGRDELFPDAKPRDVVQYKQGPRDAQTYFATIIKRQQDIITDQNQRLIRLEKAMRTLVDEGLNLDDSEKAGLTKKLNLK